MHVHSVFNKSPRAVFISNISYSQRLPTITAYVSQTLHLLDSDPLNQQLSVILHRAIVYKLHSRVSTFKPPRPHLFGAVVMPERYHILLKMGEREYYTGRYVVQKCMNRHLTQDQFWLRCSV